VGIAAISEILEYVSLPPCLSISFIPLKSTNQSSPFLAPLPFSTALTYLYSFSLPPAASLMGSGLLIPDPLLTPLSFLAEMQFFLSPINISCHGAVPGERLRLEGDLPVLVQSTLCSIILLLALCWVTVPPQPVLFVPGAAALQGAARRTASLLCSVGTCSRQRAAYITVFWQWPGARAVGWSCAAVAG